MDEVWHAGDIGTTSVTDEISKLKTLKGVYGNIDGHKLRNQFPEYKYLTAKGKSSDYTLEATQEDTMQG